MLSSEPVECIRYILHEDEEVGCEMAVFKLENNKYCFIKFLTEDINNVECGLTDLEETETEDEAVSKFDNLAWGKIS